MNERNQPAINEEWLDRLQSNGYRLTAPLRAIVDLMATSTHALSANDVYDLGRKEVPGLGLVTVYRALEKLEELELVQRVHQPGGCHMFLRAAQGHEHLLLCTACGRAVFFKGDDLKGLMADIADRSGYQITDHWLQLYGLCAACKRVADKNN